MNNKISKTKALGIIQRVTVILIIIIAIFIFVIYKITVKPQVTYTVINGYVEKIIDTKSYILKNESTIDYEKNNSFIPIIEEGKRAAKNEVIAIYKNADYDNYLNQINELDASIETLIKDLPVTYSADISKINAEIEGLTEKSIALNSYVKMQEYKTKLDELSYKKITVLSDLSPTGSKIRELIKSRKKLEDNYKNSKNNIKTTKSGVVSYKIDNLENIFDFDKIMEFKEDDIESIIEKYNSNISNEFGIKIIDNFNAYLLVKVQRTESDDNYIKIDKKYNLKLTDEENKEITAVLRKKIIKDDNNYLLFEINNYIEELIDLRTTGVEIVWEKTEGMAVLKKAILKSDDGNYDYVVLVNGGQFLQIPIKIISSSDTVCIVENLSSEEKEQLGITTNAVLELYDILVVQE